MPKTSLGLPSVGYRANAVVPSKRPRPRRCWCPSPIYPCPSDLDEPVGWFPVWKLVGWRGWLVEGFGWRGVDVCLYTYIFAYNIYIYICIDTVCCSELIFFEGLEKNTNNEKNWERKKERLVCSWWVLEGVNMELTCFWWELWMVQSFCTWADLYLLVLVEL